ncbi:MAG TPA: hypothetical protein VIT88_02090 [Pyrinomonadaceae bacterium]
MGESDEIVDEAKEDLKKVPKRTGPAGLLVFFYITAALVGLLVIVWFLWLW